MFSVAALTADDSLVKSKAIFALLGGLLFSTAVSHASYDGSMNPGVVTDQDEINAGEVAFPTLFYRGMHLYTNQMTTEDGFGEAPDGPRRGKQSLAGNKFSSFLRFNGLDAQACFECHAANGMKHFDDMSMPRETGSIGAGGGFSANVFIFEEPNNLDVGLVRNPPHTFGLGYIQRLAEEMTADLLSIRDAAILESTSTGEVVRKPLVSKGVSFGHISTNAVGGIDFSEVEGVSIDLVVRPFQFKGIASSLRNFVVGAMNFHFSVQPKEALDRFLIPDDNPNGTLAGDKRDEILEGEISTTTIFVSALRPPMQSTDGLDEDAVTTGRALMDSIGCTVCHVPSLRVDDSRITIVDPRFTNESAKALMRTKEFVSYREKMEEALPAMVPAEAHSSLLPSIQLYDAQRATSSTDTRLPGYTYDLNDQDLPDEALPRLPFDAEGRIDVPLFSDLRRHHMGADLADTRTQPTDVQSIEVAADEFVTRPLWGVSDTGPWLHDGRATTLHEAILMHAGEGSEANDAVAAFEALDHDSQKAVITFLKSLRTRSMPHAAEPGIVHRTGFVVR